MLEIVVNDTEDLRTRWKEPVARFLTTEAAILSDRPVDLKMLLSVLAILSAKLAAALKHNEALNCKIRVLPKQE